MAPKENPRTKAQEKEVRRQALEKAVNEIKR